MERNLKDHVDPIESYFVKPEGVLENVIALVHGSNFNRSLSVKILSSLLVVALLSGCNLMPRLEWGPEPIVVQPEPQIVTVTEKVPLRIYQPPLPGEIDLLDVNFFVITEENYEEKKKEIEKILDGNFVVFALLPDGYEKMAENFQEVRRYVRQQKELIIYYREATTESEGTTAEEWQENNE